jgi:hypothetical protein
MNSDEQKNDIKKSKLFKRYKFNISHVLSTVRIRSFIQDALKHYWELLGYRYYILLLIRGFLAIVLGSIQIL